MNPWKFLRERQVYSNPWIDVVEHDVINPSGGAGIYGLVRFRNLAIGIIPLDEHRNTWLVGQHRYALDAWSWEIPMGGVPKSEDPLAGARRELREETGIEAGSWRELMRLHTSNSVTDEAGIVYLAEQLTFGPTEFGATEDIRIRKLPLADAVRCVTDGEITDAISVAGLLGLARSLAI
jgi:8-oxo-dGTP pyrophosphatase MutT (NUDIX family)